MNYFKKLFLLIPFVLILICSCEKTEDPTQCSTEIFDYTYRVPPNAYDGWTTASLNDVGLSEYNFYEMMDDIEDFPNHHLNGILIIKDRKLVFEEYFGGTRFNFDDVYSEGDSILYTLNTEHFLASVSKSVTSLLVGIAVDEGLINGPEDHISEYFQSLYPNIFVDGKEDITLEHLLTMSSGLPWDESSPYNSGQNDVSKLFNAADPINFVLSRSLEATPGTLFKYNSGGTNVAADMIRLTFGATVRTFARIKFFEPLEINNYHWESISRVYLFASGGLFLKPRDLAKIGQLTLDKGKWNDKQIVSENWINNSIQNRINPQWHGFANGYGYQWWLYDFNVNGKIFNCYFAAGWGEQMMYIFPSENMIVIFLGQYYSDGPPIPTHQFLYDYILRSLK